MCLFCLDCPLPSLDVIAGYRFFLVLPEPITTCCYITGSLLYSFIKESYIGSDVRGVFTSCLLLIGNTTDMLIKGSVSGLVSFGNALRKHQMFSLVFASPTLTTCTFKMIDLVLLDSACCCLREAAVLLSPPDVNR